MNVVKDDMPEYCEPITACNFGDLQEDEMIQVNVDDNTKALIIKQNNRVYAVGNKCPHYGAPLHTGALGEGRIRCPWHGACFNIATGDIEDFPGVDSLPCYKVTIKQDTGEIQIRGKKSDIEKNKRLKDMVKQVPTNKQVFVIVGGGPAGGICAETLRQSGYTGRIVMLCRENSLPYDRVKLSKTLNVTLDAIQFRNAAFYAEYNIETMLGVEATQLDTAKRIITCSNDHTIKFDKLFIATGSSAFKPDIKGANLKNVLTLRDHSDAEFIDKSLKASMQIVCLGSSFIALETAAALVRRVKSVTLVGRDKVPLKHVLGEAVGDRLLELFKENRVHMMMESGIEEIIGNENDEVTSVKLIDGTILPCDILIMGTGTKLNTTFLNDSGINVNENGSIDADMYLMSNVRDIFVGGDIANAPVFSNANQRLTIGHYQLAQYHGRIAGLNMAGKRTELHAVPFFFTMFFGKGIRFSGFGQFERVQIEGELDEMKFIAYYMDKTKNVVGIATCGRDPIVAQYSELVSQGKRLTHGDVMRESVVWTRMLRPSLQSDK